jgi:hypothetical protein
MTTVSIVPISTGTSGQTYQAVAGKWMAAGVTAGKALDALIDQYPEIEAESILAVRLIGPGKLLSEQQQLTEGE